jgi:hypothetical protein
MTANREKGREGLGGGDAHPEADGGYAYPPEAIAVLEGLPVSPPRPTFNIGGDDDAAEDQAGVPSPMD